jgi:hypothetical protein
MEGEFFDEGMWPEYCNPLYQMPEEIQVKVTSSQAGEFVTYSFPVVRHAANQSINQPMNQFMKQ